MDKLKVFEMAKTDLKQLIEQMQPESLHTNVKQIQQYITFLESLVAIEGVCDDEPNKEETCIDEQENFENSQPMEEEPVYSFERKLKGGYLPDIDAYVPETIVRSLDLKDGDQVKATEKGLDHKQRLRYHYELAQKGKGQNDPNRCEIKYCIVEKDQNLWVCQKNLAGENIRIDDMPFTIRIRESEVQEFRLAEGDIVDVAYYANNPVNSRVNWKHEIEDEIYHTPLPSSVYKDKSSSIKAVEEHPDLKRKTITLIGCIDRQTIYKDHLTQLGAVVQGLDGTEDEQRVSSMIVRADLVLIIIPAVSHRGSGVAKKHCKANDIPFATVESIGTTTVVNRALNLARELKYEQV
ncbi:DUF2325 domain-containing protein [Tuberibacillus sp. Marseille-P3662]|uniref:DUF2325 domain-containing protein n=1 Tax=Tuberibacillus sp. Marseille-P3662 TaxID=1965358 RepID=UPI000A1CD7A7|nr:DUF2325 domain-containing protein [Tuberibacillus sp. Marseille-P3662]